MDLGKDVKFIKAIDRIDDEDDEGIFVDSPPRFQSRSPPSKNLLRNKKHVKIINLNPDLMLFRSQNISDVDSYCLALTSPNLRCLTDVTFEVGHERVEVHAHKIILARKSPYFLLKFVHHFAMHKRLNIGDSTTTPIWIPEMEPDGFKIMLRYLYNNKIEMPSGGINRGPRDINFGVRALLQAIQCAMLIKNLQMRRECIRLLSQKLSIENSVIGLNWAMQIKCITLQLKMLDFMVNNISDLVGSRVFRELSEKALIRLLGYEGWYLPEYQIFLAVEDWAIRKYWASQGFGPRPGVSCATLRVAMGRTLHAIRFPLMTFKEQREIVLRYPNLFNEEEKAQLFQYLMTESFVQGPFRTRSRRRDVRG